MSAVVCDDAKFDSEVLRSDLPALVDFWAPWCGPCQAMSPVVDAIADEFAGRLKVVKVQVEDGPQAAAQYGVTSIPNFVVVKGGRVRAKLVGALPKQALVNAFDPYLRRSEGQ